MQHVRKIRPATTPPNRPDQRRGAVLLYALLMMTMFTAICSLAVDYGHVQRVKSELQRAADATARGYMVYYMMNGTSYANSHGPSLYTQSYNPMDSNSGVSPTVTVTWGYWNPTSSTFSTGSGATTAVKVTITRTAANNNAVPLWWGFMIGVPSIDVHASSVATIGGGQSTSVSFSATSSPYLAGMPAGTVNIYGDTAVTDPPYQVTSIPVTPGTYVSFANLSGTTSVVPGEVNYTGPAGNPNYIVHHGENWDGSPDNPGPENGIADAIMPEDAMIGLFLSNDAPNLSTAPATVDWTQPSQQNQPTYSNIELQQPFMIGAGVTTNGVVQQFLVPAGATRLFVGIWDGIEYSNNDGTLSGTVTARSYVQIVQ